MTDELEHALREAARWLETLAEDGPDLTVNAHKKAAHEAQEFAENPVLEEAADVFICLMGTAVRKGWTTRDIAEAIQSKLEINRLRTWMQKPDGTWQHMREIPCEDARRGIEHRPHVAMVSFGGTEKVEVGCTGKPYTPPPWVAG